MPHRSPQSPEEQAHLNQLQSAADAMKADKYKAEQIGRKILIFQDARIVHIWQAAEADDVLDECPAYCRLDDYALVCYSQYI